MRDIVKPHPNKIIIEGFRGKDIRFYESIMSLSNGYMGIRGGFEEGCDPPGLRGTYIAGVWYPDRTKVGWWKNGYPEYFGKAVNATNIIDIGVYINDRHIQASEGNIVSFYCELDMEQSVLRRTAVLDTQYGNIKIESARFLSFDIKEVCAIRYEVTALSGAASLTLLPHIDFDVYNESSNYGEKLMIGREQSFINGMGYIEAVTKENAFGKERYGVCAAMSVIPGFGKPDVKEVLNPGGAGLRLEFGLKTGQCARIDKIVALATTRDRDDIKYAALNIAREAAGQGFDKLLERHAARYSRRLEQYGITVTGDDKARQGVDYCLYQLASSFDGSDKRLNIGPKGLTGEKYGGAAYWDTDAFLIPFYLGTCDESVARNLLLFRYNTLDAAKANAAKLGLKGALYPMVTFDGNECHNEWEITFEEIHRNGTVAYAIFNYIAYTGDEEYLVKYGFPILLEISRFWADRVHFCERKGVYMIHGVTGPNEYENNVNNNWYTNRMAKWCLDYTVSVAEEYAEKLDARYSEEEMEGFREISNNIYLPYDSERNIFVQQDGYLDKEFRAADTLSPGERPLWQHWSWDKILRSCFIKQADVLQGMYFLNDAYDNDTVRRNFEFYEPYTVHESSLSAGVHSVVASRAGLREKAYELFSRAARLDLGDLGNDTSDGLHITAMSGVWLAVVQGFAGMNTTRGVLDFEPYLPRELETYSFTIQYRGRAIRIEVSSDGIKAAKLSGEKVQIYIFNKPYLLEDVVNVNLPEEPKD